MAADQSLRSDRVPSQDSPSSESRRRTPVALSIGDVFPETTDRAPRSKTQPARPADSRGDDLSDEQLSEIRTRIAAGVYNSREVAEEVARRMLDSGDV